MVFTSNTEIFFKSKYWPRYIGSKGTTLAKAYGTKWGAIGNMLRNTSRTWWEESENLANIRFPQTSEICIDLELRNWVSHKVPQTGDVMRSQDENSEQGEKKREPNQFSSPKLIPGGVSPPVLNLLSLLLIFFHYIKARLSQNKILQILLNWYSVSCNNVWFLFTLQIHSNWGWNRVLEGQTRAQRQHDFAGNSISFFSPNN
jgi:hypothetical protein